MIAGAPFKFSLLWGGSLFLSFTSDEDVQQLYETTSPPFHVNGIQTTDYLPRFMVGWASFTSRGQFPGCSP